ncbi:MAG TPA: catecholate siderophore receptor Fiu [Rhizobacter sp.]|nr:catecholate siderophore receptor Fiu [Rhizobacter sp.]
MAYIKSRKHAAPRQSAFMVPAALGLMAMSAAAQTTAPPTEPKKPESAQEVTLPPVKAKATVPETDFKADAVASPKFTQPLVDTPQTITVIKKELMQQQSATTLTEALRNTPGVTLQLGENGNTTTGDGIFMRGFDTSNSIFVDGIRDLGNISRDMFNIEQVEVVKGPSGSDNGRGASSGYVNLVSKMAGQEAFNNGSIVLGTDQRIRATADLNKPLDLGIPGSALRLNVMAQDYGVPGRDEVENKSFGFAPSLAFGLGTPTRAYFNYLYVKQNNVPDGGVSTFGMPGYVLATATPANRAGAAVDPSNYYGSLGDYNDVTVNMFTAKIEHEFAPGIVLRNTTRMGHTAQDYVITGVNGVLSSAADPNAWQVARSRQGRHQTNEILTNQTNLATSFATGSVTHDLSTGIELTYERQNQENALTLTDSATLPASLRQPRANLYNPSTGDVFLTPPATGAYTKGQTLTAAVYGFDTLKFNEQWLATAGLRWEKFHTETNSATYTAPTTTAAGFLTQNGPLAITDDLLSWKLGAVFKPATEGSIYAAVSNSYQPPGGTNFQLANGGNSQSRTDFVPQEASNIELGAKWDLLGGKLGLTGAIYRAENKNEIVSDGGSPAIYSQIGKRRVDGLELGVVGQVTPELNLNAGFAYMDSEIMQGNSGTAGNAIVYTPKITFTSWVSYKLLPALTLGGGVRYIDTVARTSNPNVTVGVVEVEPYWVADAMVSYDVTKNVSLQLNLNNLFDKEYVASVNNGGTRYTPGVARNALLTANLSF